MARSFTPMALPPEESQTTTTRNTTLYTRTLAGFPVSTCPDGSLKALSNYNWSPLYATPVEPRTTHDITAAKTHIFDAMWATGLWIFGDKSNVAALCEGTNSLLMKLCSTSSSFKARHTPLPTQE